VDIVAPMTIQHPIQPRILVTGATSGIGHAVAAALARQGAAVVLVGRSHTRLERALAQLDGKEHHRLVVADLADDEQVTKLARVAIEDGAPLDGLIHCAGTFELARFEKVGMADLDQTWAINARAPFRLTQALCSSLRDGAAIVFVTSVSAHVGMAGQTAYAMTKGALEAFARALAVELAERSIRVNTVAPGYVATAMNAKYRQGTGVAEERASAALAGRLGAAEDIASAVVFLVSEEASFVNATTLHVDGGYPIAEVQRGIGVR
jgi:NAD(P)-dependent dehydrogenase (short-subunit alcohol dehydrogenase family)